MGDRLPPRPGEPTPGGDIGKKGGDAPPPERPTGEPTELPGRKPDPKPIPQPTI